MRTEELMSFGSEGPLEAVNHCSKNLIAVFSLISYK